MSGPLSSLRFHASGLLLAVATTSHAIGGNVVFVDDDAPAGGDGTTWNTAYRFLQDALADAFGGGVTEIRVGQGTYKPDRDEANPDGTGDREATFQLINGVALMGGYAGLGAKDPDARDTEVYETILTGDLAGNDMPDFQGYDENSYSVVRGSGLSEETRLDGFVIGGGNANGPVFEFRRGGGLRMDNDHIGLFVLADCVFTENLGDGAGGAYLRDVIASVSGCTFAGNESTNDNAGGLEALFIELSITDCVFANNVSPFGGGGMVLSNFEADVLIENCLFDSNQSTFSGGGLNCSPPFFNNLNLVIRGCEFRNNESTNLGSLGRGGGLYANIATLDLIDCVFVGNTGGFDGGGAFVETDAASNVVNCTFKGNTSMAGAGGGLHLFSSEADSVVNSLFVGNTAAGAGGGLANPQSGGGPGRRFLNCTLAGNTSGDVGGGLMAPDSDNEVDNCIFWANTDINGSGQASQIAFADQLAINYSCIDGWDGSLGGIGNHGNDPLFIDLDGADNIIGTDDDDARLQAGSPCIDAANNWGVTVDELDYDEDGVLCELLPVDLDGNPRFNADEADFDPGCGVPVVVDMGAYEYQFDPAGQVTFADLNDDDAVGAADLLGLLASWGSCGKGCCLADLDIDGIVGASDLLALLANWGPCP